VSWEHRGPRCQWTPGKLVPGHREGIEPSASRPRQARRKRSLGSWIPKLHKGIEHLPLGQRMTGMALDAANTDNLPHLRRMRTGDAASAGRHCGDHSPRTRVELFRKKTNGGRTRRRWEFNPASRKAWWSPS
jgi:hypothetical protein